MGFSIMLALVAGGIAFTVGPGLVSGAIGIAAFAVFTFACVASWMEHAQGARAPRVFFRPGRGHGGGQFLGAPKLPPARAIRPNKIGVAKLTDCLGPILLAARP